MLKQHKGNKEDKEKEWKRREEKKEGNATTCVETQQQQNQNNDVVNGLMKLNQDFWDFEGKSRFF